MQAISLPGYDTPADYGFSAAVRSHRFVFFSGMVGADLSTLETPTAHEDEVRLLFFNLDRLATAAGVGLERLVAIESFHAPLTGEAVDVFRRVRAEFLSPPLPAWTVCGVAALAVPGARVEVKAVAEVGA